MAVWMGFKDSIYSDQSENGMICATLSLSVVAFCALSALQNVNKLFSGEEIVEPLANTYKWVSVAFLVGLDMAGVVWISWVVRGVLIGSSLYCFYLTN